MAVGPRRHMNLYQSLYCYGIKMKRRSSQWADIHTLLKSVQADCEIYISERERREACGLMCNAYTYSPTTKGHWYICRISIAEILSCPCAGLLMHAFPPAESFLISCYKFTPTLWNLNEILRPPGYWLFSTYDTRNCFCFPSHLFPILHLQTICHPDPTKTAEIVTSTEPAYLVHFWESLMCRRRI